MHKVQTRKRQRAVQALDKMFLMLEEVFHMGGPIKQVLVILGSTVVTPKEVFVLKFPTSFSDSHSVSLRNCMSVLFRNLVIRDWFGDVKPLKSCTKLHVMVQAPRQCNFTSQMLLPKVNYKIPPRGKHFVLNFTCRAHVTNAELSQLGDSEFDISGVEQLNHSASDIDMGPPMRSSSRNGSISESGFGTFSANHLMLSRLGLSGSQQNSRHNSLSESGMDVESVHLNDSKTAGDQLLDVSTDCVKAVDEGVDYIWYQMPVALTGYKDKASRKAPSGGDWLL